MSTLPPCELEDSANCYWDSGVQGAANGGQSFIDVNGEAYYAEAVTPAEDGMSTDFTFDPNSPFVEDGLFLSLPDGILCWEDADYMFTCNVPTGREVEPLTETDTDDSYVASPPTPTETTTPTTTTESTTVTVTPPPSTLAETGGDFDPFLGLGIGAILIFVGASAYMIDRIKKVRR